MKITNVEAIYLRQSEVRDLCDSGQDALVVRVETDAGITGIGEVDSNPLAVKGAIEGPFSHTTATGLAQVVIGEDPFETEKLWHKMYRANIYGGRRGAGLHAISGIDIALWAQVSGQPIEPGEHQLVARFSSDTLQASSEPVALKGGGTGSKPAGSTNNLETSIELWSAMRKQRITPGAASCAWIWAVRTMPPSGSSWPRSRSVPRLCSKRADGSTKQRKRLLESGRLWMLRLVS